MHYTVKILPIAHRDLQKAKKWYNEQRENLGEEFKTEVNKEIDYITKHPKHYQLKYKELRQSLVMRFPYLSSILSTKKETKLSSSQYSTQKGIPN